MSQLGRVGRRAVPLLQPLQQAAVGGSQQFSSAADPPAGRGAGRGGALRAGYAGWVPKAPGSGTRPQEGLGRGAVEGKAGHSGVGRRWQPRQEAAGQEQGSAGSGGGDDASSGSGSVRQPGAMSELLRSRQRNVSRGEAGGAQPPAAFRRRPPPRSQARGDEAAPVVTADAAIPPELNDTPYDILTQFSYALRNPLDPEAEAVPMDELVSDISDMVNMDNLALLKYYMTPREWQAFSSGSMDIDSQNELMDKLAANLVADEGYREKQENVKAAIDADPDYDLAASLGSEPKLRGTHASPPSQRQLAADLDEHKEELMSLGDLTEEEYSAFRQEAVSHMLQQARQLAAPVLPDHLKREQRLAALLDKSLPQDHPYYAAVKQRIAVLQANPSWPHERKMVFAKRLIKRFAAM